jgi:thiol-disulfide isomerase/thioredoxin
MTELRGRVLTSTGAAAIDAKLSIARDCRVRPHLRAPPVPVDARGRFAIEVPASGICEAVVLSGKDGAMVYVPTFDDVVDVDIRMLPLSDFTDEYVGGLTFREPSSRSAQLANLFARSEHKTIEPPPKIDGAADELRAFDDAGARADPMLRRAASMALAVARGEDLPRQAGRRLLTELESDDPLLSLWPMAPWWAFRSAQDDALSVRLERIVAEHPNPEVGAALLLVQLEDARARGAAAEEGVLRTRLHEDGFAQTAARHRLSRSDEDHRRKAAAPSAGTAADDVTFETLDGDALRVSSLAGRVVVLYFITSWCKPCKKGVAELQELQARHGVANFQPVIASLDDNRDAATAIAQWIGEDAIPVAFVTMEGRVELDRRFTILGRVPTWILLDRAGRVIDSSHHGGDVAEALAHALAAPH